MKKDSVGIEEMLLREYGAVVGGRQLRKALGFETPAAFSKAVREGYLPLEFFAVPGRRGRFVTVIELAKWISRTANENSYTRENVEKKEGTKM